MTSTPIDVLILGGGIQGVALLRELADDFSTLLVGDDPGVSETLHFHGYFSSGWNAANLDAAKIYRQAAAHWRKLLASTDLVPQQTSFHAALPLSAAALLEGNWQAAGIAAVEEPFPAPFELGGLPEHRVFRFEDDLVFDGAKAYERFRESVADRTRVGRAIDLKRSGKRITEVAAQLGEEIVRFQPEVVLSACGAGNAQILEMLGLPDGLVRRSQLVRPLHMVLARGAGLPKISGYLFDLGLFHHPFDQKEGLWIATFNPSQPRFTAGMVDMTRDPDVEPDVVLASLNRLAAVVPDFHKLAQNSLWDVYAGWKTDAPGPQPTPLLDLQYPTPYDVRDFGLRELPGSLAESLVPRHDCGRRRRPRDPHTLEACPCPVSSSRGNSCRRGFPARQVGTGRSMLAGVVNVRRPLRIHRRLTESPLAIRACYLGEGNGPLSCSRPNPSSEAAWREHLQDTTNCGGGRSLETAEFVTAPKDPHPQKDRPGRYRMDSARATAASGGLWRSRPTRPQRSSFL